MQRKLLRGGLICCLALMPGLARADRAPGTDTQTKDLTVRLRLNHIEPSALTVPAGSYTIHIINGIVPGADIGYELRKANGTGNGSNNGSENVPVLTILQGYTQIATKSAPKGTARVRMAVTLTPGQYILWIPGRQEWQCQITVTNKP